MLTIIVGDRNSKWSNLYTTGRLQNNAHVIRFITRENGRDPNQSYAKSPYIHRKIKKAT